MDKVKLAKQMMKTFLVELGDRMPEFNRALLALEKKPSAEERAEHLTNLFREAHSLKGAARAADVPLIERACHLFEEILSPYRDGQMSLGPTLFSLLFETADAIEEAGMRMREQQDLVGAPLSALLPRLEAVCTGSAPPAGQESPTPSATAAEPPVVPPEAIAKKQATRLTSGPVPKEVHLPAPTRQTAPPAPVTAPPAAPAAPVIKPEYAAGASGSGGFVRVPAEKLDALLTGSGELLVARRRVKAEAEELAAVREFIGRWKAEWRVVEKALAKLLPRKETDKAAYRASHTGPEAGRFLPQHATQVLGQNGDNLRRLEKDLERLLARMAADGRQLDQASNTVHDEVRRVRMLPFAEACQGLDRTVRDLAKAGGKEVELVIEGGDVELDRSILEGLKDPLLHLVRNAVDHGADAPDQRRAAGKPPTARITISAALRGSQVEVVVADDGRGISLEALREQARKRKLPEPTDDRDLMRIIFLPGFSTARIITDVSGRGVGLDVVKSRVEALHGTVDLSSRPGQGTRFTLIVPLTLTTLRALLVKAGGQVFAFAGTNVQQLVRMLPTELRSVAAREMLSLGGTPLPVASLGQTLGLRTNEADRPGEKIPILVIAAGEKRMAFAVDEFLAEQVIVVKGLGARIRKVRHISGATILPSGGIALVLNAANLVRTALGRLPGLGVAAGAAAKKGEAKKRLLVVDDSVTTRTLEKSILEAAGYEVATAADGAAGWQFLQEHGADLLVSDVDMPRMDGIALTAAVRGSKRFRDLPVVLVTARETEEDKIRGTEVGANAYLIKSAFDQSNLLETISQLL